MRARIRAHSFSGTIRIPASKSHTIRQLVIAGFAQSDIGDDGVSEIIFPLDSLDTGSCAAVCRALGAAIIENRDGGRLVSYTVRGNNGSMAGGQERRIDVGNSGTALYFVMAAAGLGSGLFTITGDDSLRRRSAAPLLDALRALGVRAESVNGNGCAPVVVQGPWKGGKASLYCQTSQYLSALLLAAPCAPAGTVTELSVPLLNERPYIEMTLSYLDARGIPYEAADDFSRFVIPGGAAWKPFSRAVPGDFSSAAFPACAAAISGGPVTILGLDPNDTQGDKYFFEILSRMGCEVCWEEVPASDTAAGTGEYRVTVSRGGGRHGSLRGGTFDLNATPDLLPPAAVTAAFAEGDTVLCNAAHARIKESDRIAVMAAGLGALGVRCTERPDGLIVHGAGQAGVSGGIVDSHGDHRVAMAFAAAALAARSPIAIDGAECAAVSYPGFLELLQGENY